MNEWVKVSDRLPPLTWNKWHNAEMSESVLIWLPDRTPHVHFATCCQYEKGRFTVWSSSTTTGSGPLRPTHWMEIQAPEGESK